MPNFTEVCIIPGAVTEWLANENVQKLLSEGHHGLNKLVTGYFIVVVFVTYVVYCLQFYENKNA